MPVSANKVEDPCEECRTKHLRCDNTRPKCRNCERSPSRTCTRNGGKLRFRPGSSAKYDTIFEKSQTWLTQSKHAKIQFVDQGPELENQYSLDDADSFKEAARYLDDGSVDLDGATIKRTPTASTIRTSPTLNHSSPVDKTSNFSFDLNIRTSVSTIDSGRSSSKRSLPEDCPSPSTHRRIDRWRSTIYDPVRSEKYNIPSYQNGVAGPVEDADIPPSVTAEYRRLADTEAAQIPEDQQLTPEVWKKSFSWPNHFTTTQCSCLMRYFCERLAPWFDVGDPERTFTSVVPQRALRCPPLLNAIFTAAARSLSSLERYKNKKGVTVYSGIELPNLGINTALHYFQACIAYLKPLGENGEHIQDENLLAAAIILRYYEEFDYDPDTNREEPKLFTFYMFVNAQAKHQTNTYNASNGVSSPSASSEAWSPITTSSSSAAHTRPNITSPPPPNRQQVIAQLKTFRHACFRVALRQEVTASFSKQRAVQAILPSTWSLLCVFSTPASTHNDPDFVHSDRHLLHCAKVLQFCYGAGEKYATPSPVLQFSSATVHEQYAELNSYQCNWKDNKPLGFQPIHYARAVTSANSFTLPQIWYLSNIHAYGLSYFNLAKILLTVFDPATPKLGFQVPIERKRMEHAVRELVVSLCGVSASNDDSQSAKIQAFAAIVVCGECFADVSQEEQDSLWKVVQSLEKEWGWKTKQARTRLRMAWGWQISPNGAEI